MIKHHTAPYSGGRVEAGHLRRQLSSAADPRVIIAPHSPHRLLITHPTPPKLSKFIAPNNQATTLLYHTSKTQASPTCIIPIIITTLTPSYHPSRHPRFMTILPTRPPKTHLPMHGMIIVQRNQDTTKRDIKDTSINVYFPPSLPPSQPFFEVD